MEEGPRTTSLGGHPSSGTTSIRLSHTLRRRRVSLHNYLVRCHPTGGFRYLVNAKPERGTLRDVLRSGVQIDPMKLVRELARRLGCLLTIYTDQGDCTAPSLSSYHGTSYLPRGSQFCTHFVYEWLCLILTTCRRPLSLTTTGTRCCRISDSQRYS